MTDFVLDIPAFDVDDDDHGIFGSDALSTPDTGTELVLEQTLQPLLIHQYGWGTTGNIALPTTPDGWTLTHATYVVLAYAESAESGDLTGWSPDIPAPTQLPFLIIETSATIVNFTLDPIPRGAYGDEIVYVTNDVTNVVDDIPANRIWLQSPTSVPIHVAYAAVRLTYSSSFSTTIAGEPDETRRVFY